MKKAVYYFRAALWLFVFTTLLVGVGSAWAAEREWLILFYISGANDRGLNGFAKDVINQLEKVGSTDKVSVVVTFTILSRNQENQLQFQREVKTLLIRSDNGNPEIISPVKELILFSGSSLFDPGTQKSIKKPYPERSRGLSIYLPERIYDSAGYEPLAFATGSPWPIFIRKMLEERLRKLVRLNG